MEQDASIDDLIQRIQEYAQIKIDKENQNPKNYSTIVREKQTYSLVEAEPVEEIMVRQTPQNSNLITQYITQTAVSSRGRSDIAPHENYE